MAGLITETSSLFMLSNDALGSEILSKKFQALLYNDLVINDSFFNGITLWQCFWYYDSSVKGYNIGDAVWYNTQNPIDFIQKKYSIIKEYTDYNSVILNKLPEWSSTDENVVEQYYNAMSGYTDKSIGKDVVLPPIFDIGLLENPIQIFVSTKNNNKDLLSNEKSWKKVFVDLDSDLANIRNIIDNYLKRKTKTHLKEYHFLEQEKKVLSQLSDYIDSPLSNNVYTYTNLPSSWYMPYSNINEKTTVYGIDYATYYVRKPLVLSGVISEYQAVRYWKSGMIEHFGIIAKDNPIFTVEQDNAMYCKIPFNWKIVGDNSGAKAYKFGEIGIPEISVLLTATETDNNYIQKKDSLINVVYEQKNVIVENSLSVKGFADSNYSINIFPVYQNQTGIDNDYIPISYGENKVTQNWNSNFITNELLDFKDRNAIWFRLDERIVTPYISYYATGFGG